MNKVIIVFVAIAALQVVVAKPPGRARAQPTPTTKSPLDEFVINTKHVVQNISQSLGFENLPDSKQVVEKLQQHSEKLADNIQEAVEKFKADVNAREGEVNTAIENARAKLTQTAASLRETIGKDATARAEQIKQNLNAGLQNAVDEVQKITKAIEPDVTQAKQSVEEAARSLLDSINSISENLKSEFKSAVEDMNKGH